MHYHAGAWERDDNPLDGILEYHVGWGKMRAQRASHPNSPSNPTEKSPEKPQIIQTIQTIIWAQISQKHTHNSTQKLLRSHFNLFTNHQPAFFTLRQLRLQICLFSK